MNKRTWEIETEFTNFTNGGELEIDKTTGTYSINDDKIKLCDDSDDCYVFNYKISKHELILSEKDLDDGCEFVLKFEK